MKIIRNISIAVALLFGLLTVVAGTSVLLGTDPGYLVYRPLLIYNAVMGFVYIAAGLIAYRNIKQGMYMASAIFALNCIALITVFSLYSEGSTIAVDSLRAMSLRTGVWFMLLMGFWWVYRGSQTSEDAGIGKPRKV